MKRCVRKTCLDYGKEKSLDMFYKNKSKPDGHDEVCRSCRLELSELYRLGKKDDRVSSTTGSIFIEKLQNEVNKARKEFLNETLPHYANSNVVNAS
jgi:hypothetical protein